MKRFSTVLVFLLLLAFGNLSWAHASNTESPADTLLPVVGDALTHAKTHDYPKVAADIQQFEQDWHTIQSQIKNISADQHRTVDQALATAKSAIQTTPPDSTAVSSTLSTLAKATNGLTSDTKSKAPTASSGIQKLQTLSTFLQKSLTAVQQGNFAQAKSEYKHFEDGWTPAEQDVRKDDFNVYAQLEIKMSLVHVALNVDAPDSKKATDALQNLLQEVTMYVNSTYKNVTATTQSTPAQGQATVADLLPLLEQAQTSLQARDTASAANTMQQFIQTWPAAEGQVMVKSSAAYTQIETHMTLALQLLSTTPPDAQAAQNVIAQMQTTLQPFVQTNPYTAFDAGMVLFREGLEALLVVSALLAFLNRTGHRTKQAWVWGGVGAGLVASAGLATVMTLFFSTLTGGNNREMIEGVTGLVAVMMMFTVGVWLHSKSSGQAWNRYIQHQMGSALARGSLWSLALVSFLAIVQEGAETIIFYLGMASSIDSTQLLLGIVGALLMLVILGLVIIRFSVRIPIKPFFLVASLFIYYIAFKFLGESVHVLQVVNWIPAHTTSALPTVEWLGLFPTWESSMAQAALLVLIFGSLAWTKRTSHRAAEPAESVAP